ncbi:Endonuclease V [Methylacidimicrobium cyclopophantes]|uniref:Endonuclease V n=1 Tax=Methylacidimicrobium cyclopophantes TaxID=1041766 RepID=A0A5E6MRI6_9BACT|nr:endonuclease V [Methylacidimicrobium cyclopophantes]VVM08550.1 Endonuclease V [Methylacidimicrobium cyclopophantes]
MNYCSYCVQDAGEQRGLESAGPWPRTVEDLILVQKRIGQATSHLWTPAGRVFSAAGCFVCFSRGRVGAGRPGEAGWAAAALLRSGRIVAAATVCGTAQAAYEPGLLALREGLLLEEAVRRLPERPDLLLVNATGRDHPRGAGLAVHLGIRLALPTVGVTRNPLLASGEPPAEARGSLSPLFLGGTIVAYWLRTQRGKRPLVAHAAWQTDARTAASVLLALTTRWRTPEPLREARRLAREARSEKRGDG